MKITVQKRLLIYKILLFVFAFFVAFVPSTATRSKEVNSRVIVEILGLDGSDKISLTAQYDMPTESKDATNKDTVTVEADTVSEAVEALNTALGRQAELGHCSIIVLGSDVKPEVLGTLMSVTDVTADVYVCAAEDKAKDFVSDVTEFMKNTGATDAQFIAYSAKRAHVAINTMLGFLSDIGSASKSAFVPVVQMIEEQEGSGGGEQGGQSGQSGSGGGGQGGQVGEQSGGQSKKKTGMRTEKLALYTADGRQGVLDSAGARGVAWVSTPIESGTVTADVELNGETIKDVTGRLIKKSASVKVDGKSGSATVKVKAHIEPSGDKFNILGATNSIDATVALKAGFAKKIESEIRAAVASATELGCDPLFIGRQFYRYEPDYFDNGFDLKNTELKYEIDIVIK